MNMGSTELIALLLHMFDIFLDKGSEGDYNSEFIVKKGKIVSLPRHRTLTSHASL